MKRIKADYLNITLPWGGKRASGVLQVVWPHLIGRVYVFNNPDSYFEVLEQIQNEGSPFMCIANTSVIVKLVGTLKDFNEGNIDNFDKYVNDILSEMGEYYISTLSEGQQKHIGERFLRKV